MKCVSKIRERITPGIRDCAGKHVKSAQVLWEHLRARFGRATAYASHLAMRDVYNCNMAHDKPVAEHLANVSRLVETARQKGSKISPEDETWCVVLNLDAKFTVMSLFNEITDQFSERDVENLKLRIEIEERRLTEMNQLRRRKARRNNIDKKSDEEAQIEDKAHFALALREEAKPLAGLSGWYGDRGSTVHVCVPQHRHLIHDVEKLKAPRIVQGFGATDAKAVANLKGTLIVNQNRGKSGNTTTPEPAGEEAAMDNDGDAMESDTIDADEPTEPEDVEEPSDEAQTDEDSQDAHVDESGEPPNPCTDVPYGPHDDDFEEPYEFDDAGQDDDPDVPAPDGTNHERRPDGHHGRQSQPDSPAAYPSKDVFFASAAC
ncbi:hypothetical protein DYB32_008006 [Aphanomyces invadans]|uniref:Uncharacterized protein n=1 Tax=Aphanomyces invadans TaxID=157072 RepID=A0A3R6VSQ9_9STRA|nr:hypothetical protein DYB32_008006 [Aphanomyces invadans]